jgi:acyl-homoserine lactone acylase PvdQ
LGRGALAVDIHNRNFDYMKHGTKIAREMDNETLQFLQIFCDGINNYAKSAMLLPF